MFLFYNFINCRQLSFRYLLLIKKNLKDETYTRVNPIPLSQFETTTAEIQDTSRCINPNLLIFEQ